MRALYASLTLVILSSSTYARTCADNVTAQVDGIDLLHKQLEVVFEASKMELSAPQMALAANSAVARDDASRLQEKTRYEHKAAKTAMHMTAMHLLNNYEEFDSMECKEILVPSVQSRISNAKIYLR